MSLNLLEKVFPINKKYDNPCNSSFDNNDSYDENNNFNPNYLNAKLKNDLTENNASNFKEKNNREPFDLKLLSYNEKQFEGTKASSKKDKSFDHKLFEGSSGINNPSIYNKNLLNEESFYSKDSKNLDISSNLRKKRGRKPKPFPESYESKNSFSNDKIIRKCKVLVLDVTLNFINYQFEKIYNGNIGQGMYMKKLFDIGKEQKADNTINFMKKFLSKTLKDIFSEKISSKFTSYLPNHNEAVIKRALNEADESKRTKFQKLFNLTFRDCLKKFIGNEDPEISEKFDEFEGFQTFDEIKYKLNEEKDNLVKMKESLINYEQILQGIKPRANKKEQSK